MEPQNKDLTPSLARRLRSRLLVGALAVLDIMLAVIVAVLLFSNTPKTETPDVAQPQSDNKTHLSIATIWSGTQLNGIYDGKTLQAPGLNQYLAAYEKLHPTIKFDIRAISFEDYFNKLIAYNDADAAPDIYQVYAPWGATYAKKGMLAKPPDSIVADVAANYDSAASTQIDGQTWGIPTEIDNYLLVYNKRIFSKAGISKPPGTWAELLRDAAKTTQKDANGDVTQYGFAFAKDDDELIGDTFLAMLASNNGALTDASQTHSTVNSPAGLDVLNRQLQLFQQGSTNIDANLYDFTNGNIAMIVVAPWVRSEFQEVMGSSFADVGVAPLPVLQQRATFQYSWFTGVMKGSKHQKAAWDFLQWFTADVQPATGTTRSGDLLAENIGAIPSRRSDLANQPSLKDPFMAAYVSELPYSVPMQTIPAFTDARSILSKQIQAAWSGTTTPQAALDKAAAAIDILLKETP